MKMSSVINTAAGTPRPMPTFAPTGIPGCGVVAAEEAEVVETMGVEEKIDPVIPSDAPGWGCC